MTFNQHSSFQLTGHLQMQHAVLQGEPWDGLAPQGTAGPALCKVMSASASVSMSMLPGLYTSRALSKLHTQEAAASTLPLMRSHVRVRICVHVHATALYTSRAHRTSVERGGKYSCHVRRALCPRRVRSCHDSVPHFPVLC